MAEEVGSGRSGSGADFEDADGSRRGQVFERGGEGTLDEGVADAGGRGILIEFFGSRDRALGEKKLQGIAFALQGLSEMVAAAADIGEFGVKGGKLLQKSGECGLTIGQIRKRDDLP